MVRAGDGVRVRVRVRIRVRVGLRLRLRLSARAYRREHVTLSLVVLRAARLAGGAAVDDLVTVGAKVRVGARDGLGGAAVEDLLTLGTAPHGLRRLREQGVAHVAHGRLPAVVHGLRERLIGEDQLASGDVPGGHDTAACGAKGHGTCGTPGPGPGA